jgi:anti-sigma factor RsiW
MQCGEVEILLADYLDGTLSLEEQTALEQHTSACVSCRALLDDASSAVRFLTQADDVTAPPELITRIAYGAPYGRVRFPFERQSLWSRLTAKWLQPILQPRLAMGMAMTILSFAMLERCTGVRVQHIEAADLNPVRIWGGVEDRALRVKDRAVKYYENLRWVYELEIRLKSLQEEQEAADQSQRATRSRKSENGATTGQSDTGRAPQRDRQ